MPADSASQPVAGQKRPPRSAGRRRLDRPGEAKLSEDRRSQIRRAQKTYRLKKEASLQQAQKQVASLEHKMQRISELLAAYRVTLQSRLQNTHCGLLKEFDSVLNVLASESEGFVQESSLDGFPSKKTRENSTPESPCTIRCDDNSTNDVIFDEQGITEPSSTCIDKASETDVSPTLKSGQRVIVQHEMVLQEVMQKGNKTDCDLPVVQVADRFGGANVLYTYSFLETTFTRRLKRSSLEHAFHIFSDPRSHPLEIFRIFRLVPCFKDREKMYPYFKDLVSSDRGGSLEISALPFYSVGGAGTHYTTKDENGNPIYPPKMRIPRRILGTLPTAVTPGDPNYARQHQTNLELCGFGGEWFDSRDVEGYLREQGVDLDGSSLFPIVHNLPPSFDHFGLEANVFDIARFSEPQNDAIASELPPQSSSCVFDLESFLMALLRGMAILGRAPGFRRSDVETAFRSALMQTL